MDILTTLSTSKVARPGWKLPWWSFHLSCKSNFRFFIIFSNPFQALMALQRVQFNRETLQPYKSQAYVKFGENLYMDRFLDTANPIKKNRSKAIQSELSSCRDRVRQLVEGKVGGLVWVQVQEADLPLRIFLSHLPSNIRRAS